MIYHRIAVNTILPPLTYSHHARLPELSRVVVTLNGKQQVGVVWQSDVVPDFDVNKILPIVRVLDDDFRLPESWRELVAFAARYYHYPLGQTVFTALPAALKETKPLALPAPPVFYTLNDVGKQQSPPAKYQVKKAAVWQALLSGQHDLGSLKKIAPNAAKYVQDFTEKQWLDCQVGWQGDLPLAPYALNAQQQSASAAVQHSLGAYQVFLLHGITGSGKTEVYFDIMAQVLASGRQVLFLLPEINLTPQLRQRIAARFADVPLAVLHSQTAAAQRGQDYLRALSGQAKLVLGTRLAVFTPLADVGLIVVDEEHDASFKQDNDLRYHARDLAIWRAKQANCPIMLGSATPSLETWHKAQSGAYRLLSLPNRAHEKAQLPSIQMLDVNKLTLTNGISPQALKLLQQNLSQGGLSLVYLNRRGFAPALFCGDCGHTFGCPHCSAKMVLHQKARQLRCHHCDFRQPIPRSCDECGNQDLTAIGQGTQRIEETLRQALPAAKIVRVDRDSVSGKNDWNALYQSIQAGEIDVLIGTQMLAKGHDFSRLNLVIVLNADGSLFSSDFRASERLFAELMQVSGRAGRGERAGQVLIQSRLPEHLVFQAVRQHDYAWFANQELSQRAVFELPPFSFQAAIRADAPNMQKAQDFLNSIRDMIAPMLPENVLQLGAVPMQMTRLAERERAQVFVESGDRKALHQALSLWQQVLNAAREHQIRWHIDVDIQDM